MTCAHFDLEMRKYRIPLIRLHEVRLVEVARLSAFQSLLILAVGVLSAELGSLGSRTTAFNRSWHGLDSSIFKTRRCLIALSTLGPASPVTGLPFPFPTCWSCVYVLSLSMRSEAMEMDEEAEDDLRELDRIFLKIDQDRA